ncbi:MAG: dTDP-4-dehydrorhamnose reductase [Bacteroidales bacterium]|nr:dTDP-4-dehydrorhamnose reductase [Candidatus Cryptobacteroides aphodequi]
MNILVAGANGQLGRELRRLSAGSAHNFIFTDVSQIPGLETVWLDITDADAVRLITESENVDVIINAAAYTNVDKAEDDLVLVDLLNNQAPAILARAAKDRGALLISISTDYVFNGLGCTPIAETQKPDPRSAYGASKLAGEIAIAKSGCRSIIIRTAWLYSPYGKNFVKTMLHLTEVNESIKVVYDQVGSPTAAADLAAAILHIIDSGQTNKTGIYHYTDEGAVSWFDFAQEIKRLGGTSATINPCLSNEFPSKAERPHYSVLDKSLFRKTFGVEIPYWRTSLEKCIERIASGEN